MESTRPHTFRIILLFLILFILGFISAKGLYMFTGYKLTDRYPDNVASARFQAIKKAIKENRQDYTFTVGYKPVLNK